MKVEDGVITRRSLASPSLAIALGGGGARGLAHIVVLEALDELGLRPVAMAGTSIGALIGALYASGMEARAIRAHLEATLRSRAKLTRNLLRARVGRFSDLLLKGRGNPVQLDPRICVDFFWPKSAPESFAELAIPFFVVTTDFHACQEVVFSSGPLGPPVAASIAIPGAFRPVEFAGRVLIDGGAVNPLPYDLLLGRADVVAAVDVTFGGRIRERPVPTPFGAMMGAGQIMMGTITAQKLKARAPDLVIRPPVERYSIFDFLRVTSLLRAADGAKDAIKRMLAERVEALQRP